MAHNNNIQNLIPHQFTSDQDRVKAAEAGRKGGAALRENNAKRKLFKETIIEMLKTTMEDGNTMQDNIVAAALRKALKGDMKAFEVIRDTAGEKPVEEKSVVVSAPVESRIEVVEELTKRFYGDDTTNTEKQDN